MGQAPNLDSQYSASSGKAQAVAPFSGQPLPGGLDGLILAGGQASRMQALANTLELAAPCAPTDQTVDKGLLLFNGMPLVAHAADFLRPHVATLWVSANRNAERYAEFGRVVADDPVHGVSQGPLAGLASVLSTARDAAWMAVVPVDVPRLPPDLIPRLWEQARHSGLAYAVKERPHPLCMLVATALRDDLDAYLGAGGRRVMEWVRRAQGVAVPFAGDGILENINTPQALEALRLQAP